MPCAIKYLSSAGIQHREVKGLQSLAAAYPNDWVIYASLNAFPKNSAPIEIDVIVIMDDRILLLELKDWNGKLTSNGDLWFVKGGSRGRSAVVLSNEKAKKIKVMIKANIPALSRVYVDSRVVLTATSTAEHLPHDEKPFVLTLDEAKALADRKERDRLLGKTKLSIIKPTSYINEIETMFGNPAYFQPLKMNWDGYGVVDEDFYVHRRDIWREHRAQLNKEERIKALLRLWRFDKLPVGLNEPTGRQLIADRELKVTAFLNDRGSWMAERGMLKTVGAPTDEVLTQHHQLVSVPGGWTTLRRYLARNGGDIPSEQRVDIMHSIALMVAELHSQNVSHRDIGSDAIWIGAPTEMSLTGFFSATLPDETSVADFLEVLGTYSDPEPDWSGLLPTAKERDVRSLGLIMQSLYQLDGDTSSLPDGWDEVTKQALARPGKRYADARALADALGELRTPSGPTVDQSRLDAFQTIAIIPYVHFPPNGAINTSGSCTRYESNIDAERAVVKIWNSMARGDARRDHALLCMLEAASALKAVPINGIASVIAAGLSPVGPYVVSRWVDGIPLSNFSSRDKVDLLNLSESLIAAVNALHSRGLAHGDLHPDNVIVTPDNSAVLIDLLDIPTAGASRLRSPSWAPEKYERQSDQQIDRFAVVKLVLYLADSLEPGGFERLEDAAQVEFERPTIETLEPILEAIERERRALIEPQAQTFEIFDPKLPNAVLETDDGYLWVKAHRTPHAMDVFWITGLDKRLLITRKGTQIVSVELVDARLTDLGYGARVPMRIETASGPDKGIEDLLAFINSFVIPEAEAELGQGTAEWEGEEASTDDRLDDEDEEYAGVENNFGGGLDVSRLWLRTAEIEEDTALRIRVDRPVPGAASGAMYTYEAPQPLEFEDDDIVEVRLDSVQGRKIGLLDIPRCDGRRLAIKDQRFFIGEGEHVVLVDRRDRVSKERRRRAVERITRRSSVIPGLIDYFNPELNSADFKFALQVSETDLHAYKLNEGQETAFRDLLHVGPVGLLQGPPGSGKTKFIASFVHWILTQGGARRVLIASQSHEAVNNVLEAVLKTYRIHGGHADLLRVGSRGSTERIRPYQAKALRERYRVRFENGLKARVGHAANAAGISRNFASDIVEIDQKLGKIKRALDLATIAAAGNSLRDERRRSDARIRTLLRAFSNEATQLFERPMEVNVDELSTVIEEAYASVLPRYPRSSPSDLTTVKRLLSLANDWKDTLASGHRNFDEFLAKTRQVVAGTCVGLGQSQIRLEEGTFDWVIVDEAARCTSGELAIPLQLGSRVILVGDQLQLRPMVDRAVQKGLKEEFRGLGSLIAQSDFERAFDSPYGKRNARVLDEQYRMTPVISDLVSDIFYAPHGVKLKPSAARQPDDAFANLSSNFSRPVVWLDTAKMPDATERDRNVGRDIWNDAEIRSVIALLRSLSIEENLIEELCKRNEPSIGVICMYSEQKRRIEKEWSQQHFTEAFRKIVTIDTVDAYQGKENSIVIVTLVRANPEYISGHVGRHNRCNVAMSRAKERLYIVGNTDMWSSPKCASPMTRVLLAIRNMNDQDGRVRDARETAL
ncbi:AAA domain-containing protein [Asticcacaulis sp. 201]|uniref:AAA domain-containing protein n=1 Tax=Asticcacaulis sp. 201 TaxID=3028787 RepID=UPI0029169A0D|nr:AAA domain-containing protein [Asticcacaulis sp. 201]MDV6333228.1 AAA domain-containing protein [Asticcacaulis sp. 201]